MATTISKSDYKADGLGASFVTTVTNMLKSNNGQIQSVGEKYATNLSRAEANLMSAYALDPGTTEESKALAKKLELKDPATGKYIENAEGIQESLKMKLSRALRSLTSFDEIVTQAHQMLMRIIGSIRVG